MRRRDHLPLLRLTACALGVALAAGACTQVSHQVVPTTTTTEQTTPSTLAPPTITWVPCEGSLECGTISVPVDHDRPDGPGIELALLRRPATDPDALIGSLLVNPGGPGGSGVELVRSGSFDGSLAQLAASFDIVGWDPRGVGSSSPVRCGPSVDVFLELDSDPDTDAERAELDAAASQVAASCQADPPELLAHLSVESTARDLDLIRRGLGETQISYLGFSYGTLIGQEYARLFPENVRAMALDGLVDPALPFSEFLRGQAVAAEGAIAPLSHLYDQVAARVETDPLPTGEGPPVGPARLAVAAFAATYARGGVSVLEDALEAAAGGDGDPLGELAESYLSGAGDFSPYLAISCVDGRHPEGPEAWRAFAEELAADAPRMGAPVANELLACATWPVPPARDVGDVSLDGLAPVLLIGNTGDVATPLVNAEAVAADLPGAVLLVVDQDGHTATGSNACVNAIVVAYLVDLALPAPGTTC